MSANREQTLERKSSCSCEASGMVERRLQKDTATHDRFAGLEMAG